MPATFAVKITLVTETFPPEVNGVAMTLDRIVRGLARAGDEVTVVRPRQAADRRGGSGGGEKPFAEWLLPGVALPKYEGLMMGLPFVGRLTTTWKHARPDVVHIATEGPLGWAALGAASKLGIPISSSFHTNFHQYGDHYGFGAIKEVAVGYLRSFHNQTAVTMVPTRQMRARLSEDGFANLAVVSRGVDVALFSPARRSAELRETWGAKPDDPVFIYVGRIAKEKNIGLAVESFLEVRAETPGARLVLVGDGPERAALQKRYPEFHFAGMQRGEALASHYASGDVFLFPSVTETFGNVVTEALGSGLVVVTYDYAAGREYIEHGRNGVLAAFDDPAAYRRAVSTISRQRGSWPAMRAAARETALGVTWDAIIARFRRTLADVAATAGRDVSFVV
ncbi:glycosyltransferase family 1 protein [Opitutales bacterium ASA1]|nr:glycosyltransferase family 1 protein [Opitutales bacterium ASA1]